MATVAGDETDHPPIENEEAGHFTSFVVPTFRHLPIYRHFSRRHSLPSRESAWLNALSKSLWTILLRNGMESFPFLARTLLYPKAEAKCFQ
jgi:hypothetical protein